MWDPAAVAADPPLAAAAPQLLAGRMLEFGKLRRRAEHLFQVGIFVFLVAVALLLAPDQWHASGTDWRWAAASVAWPGRSGAPALARPATGGISATGRVYNRLAKTREQRVR